MRPTIVWHIRAYVRAKIWEKATLAFADMFPPFPVRESYRIAIHPLGQIPREQSIVLINDLHAPPALFPTRCTILPHFGSSTIQFRILIYESM